MFVTSHLRKGPRQASTQAYQSGRRLRVLPYDKILVTARQHAVVDQLRYLSGLTEERHTQLYTQLICNFIEFVQVLPIQFNKPLYGLLTEGLARATLGLQIYTAQQPAGQADPLHCYAIFSAGLLHDLSRVISEYKVVVVEEDGTFIEEWQPLKGPLAAKQYYKLYPINSSYRRVEQSITLLLARQVMPAEGFDWLFQTPKIFKEWLDALYGINTEDGETGRSLSKIKREDIYNLVQNLVPPKVEQLKTPQVDLGEKFFNWLKNEISNKNIAVNTPDASIHVLDHGVFIEMKVFKEFADIATVPVNMYTVHEQFGNMLGIAKKGGLDYAHDQFFSETAQQLSNAASMGSPLTASLQQTRYLKDGMVLGDAMMVFANSQVPAVSPLAKAMQPKGNEAMVAAIGSQRTLNPKGKFS